MDRNNGQNKRVTERVYNSTDINRIALGYKDDKVKVERQVSRTAPSQRPAQQRPVQSQRTVQQRASQGATNTRRTPSGSRNVQQRRPSQSPSRPRKKQGNNNGFLRFLVALVILILICVLIFAFVGNRDQDSDIGETNVSETKETTPQSTDETTGGDVTTDETTEKGDEEAPIPTFSFVADLSEFETYMNPTGEDRDAYLLLVNPDNPLSSDYIPSDLVDVKSTRKDGRNTQQLRLYAAKALEALMLEAEACGVVDTKTPSGYPLSVMSAYRSYAYQNSLFNTYVNREMQKGISRAEAEAIVVTYSCRAGTSEHQSGLCVDMHTLWSANVAFAKEDEAKWLAENCYKFGFVLRFPEDKVDITKITYEPWHFRYVGRYHAVKMNELEMCLEEYTEYLKTVQQ